LLASTVASTQCYLRAGQEREREAVSGVHSADVEVVEPESAVPEAREHREIPAFAVCVAALAAAGNANAASTATIPASARRAPRGERPTALHLCRTVVRMQPPLVPPLGSAIAQGFRARVGTDGEERPPTYGRLANDSQSAEIRRFLRTSPSRVGRTSQISWLFHGRPSPARGVRARLGRDREWLASGEPAGAASVSKVLLVGPERRQAIIAPALARRRQTPRVLPRRALNPVHIALRRLEGEPR
jgi:hypothetical protein